MLHDEYDRLWAFCASLTNFHISKYPLRDVEPRVQINEEEDEEEEENN